MNISNQNSIVVVSGANGVFINGEKIEVPTNMNKNSQTIVNGKVYIGGYEYFGKEKKFKRTFMSIWHLLFQVSHKDVGIGTIPTESSRTRLQCETWR